VLDHAWKSRIVMLSLLLLLLL